MCEGREVDLKREWLAKEQRSLRGRKRRRWKNGGKPDGSRVSFVGGCFAVLR